MNGKLLSLFSLALLLVPLAACEDAFDPGGRAGPIENPSEWTLRSPYPTAERLNAFDWTGMSEGVAVGDFGTVIRTLDNGDTWTVTHVGTAELHAVDFADDTVGFVVGDEGTILRTTDGGDTWSTSSPPLTTDLYDVSTPAPQTSTAVGAGGVIVRTDDGGATWRIQNSGTQKDLTSVAFSDADHGVAGYASTLLYTNNGGATWLDKSDKHPPYLIADVAMPNPTTIVTGCTWTIFHSEDAGDTWDGRLVDAVIQSLVMVDGTTGYAIGATDVPAPTRFYTTSDGAASWSLTLHEDIGAGHMAFHRANDGMLVGGTIHTTTDGGRTWARKDRGPRDSIADVAHPDGHTAIAVGSDGVMLRSVDRGRTWQAVDHENTARIRAVSFGSPTVGLAPAADGMTLKTTDGGTTWTSLPNGPGVFTLDVHMLDEDRAVAAGRGMFRTSNGGETWEQFVPEQASRYFTVHYLSEQTIVAGGWATAPPGWPVSTQGVIVRSNDGGQTWSETRFPDIQWIYDLTFIDSDRGIAVGDGYSIYRTVDGGLTWTTAKEGPRGSSFQAVAFATDTHGIAVGTFGVVYSTRDGGVTWQPEASGTNRTLYAVSISGDGVAVAAGSSGTILTDDR